MPHTRSRGWHRLQSGTALQRDETTTTLVRSRLNAPRWRDPAPGAPTCSTGRTSADALRLLRKTPALTLLTIGVLGGGLGVSIFTFSFLYTTMLRPIPVSGGDRIVRVTMRSGNANLGIDAVDLAQMRGSITTLTDFGAYTNRELVAGEEGAAQRRVIAATAAESNIFQSTRTAAALGRAFGPDDHARGAEPVIVLSH